MRTKLFRPHSNESTNEIRIEDSNQEQVESICQFSLPQVYIFQSFSRKNNEATPLKNANLQALSDKNKYRMFRKNFFYLEEIFMAVIIEKSLTTKPAGHDHSQNEPFSESQFSQQNAHKGTQNSMLPFLQKALQNLCSIDLLKYMSNTHKDLLFQLKERCKRLINFQNLETTPSQQKYFSNENLKTQQLSDFIKILLRSSQLLDLLQTKNSNNYRPGSTKLMKHIKQSFLSKIGFLLQEQIRYSKYSAAKIKGKLIDNNEIKKLKILSKPQRQKQKIHTMFQGFQSQFFSDNLLKSRQILYKQTILEVGDQYSIQIIQTNQQQHVYFKVSPLIIAEGSQGQVSKLQDLQATQQQIFELRKINKLFQLNNRAETYQSQDSQGTLSEDHDSQIVIDDQYLRITSKISTSLSKLNSFNSGQRQNFEDIGSSCENIQIGKFNIAKNKKQFLESTNEEKSDQKLNENKSSEDIFFRSKTQSLKEIVFTSINLEASHQDAFNENRLFRKKSCENPKMGSSFSRSNCPQFHKIHGIRDIHSNAKRQDQQIRVTLIDELREKYFIEDFKGLQSMGFALTTHMSQENSQPQQSIELRRSPKFASQTNKKTQRQPSQQPL